MPDQPAETIDAKTATLVAEIRRDFPEKAADVERYVAGERYLRLDPDRRLEALHILRGALQDARRKAMS